MYSTCKNIFEENSKKFNWGKNINWERWDEIQKYCTGQVLDFGCGAGSYVYEMRRNKIEAFGVDILKYPSWGDSDFFSNVDMFDNHLPFQDKFFQSTILFEVLEHVQEPLKLLDEIKRVTKEYILITVPNCEDNEGLIKSDLVLRHWNDRTHINFYTINDIQSMLTAAGYKIEKIKLFREVYPEFLLFYLFGVIGKYCEKLFHKVKKITQISKLRKPLYGSIFIILRLH